MMPRLLPLLFVLAATLTPLYAEAAAVNFFGPIVPAACRCDEQTNPEGGVITTAPAYGCVLQTVQNVIRFAVTLGIFFATLALVYAGFVWMTSRGNPERVSQGRNMLLNVFVGLAVLLAAWLIVDFIMKTLYNESTEFGPWNSILSDESENVCLLAVSPQSLTTGSLSLNTAPGGSGGATPAGNDGSGGTVSNQTGRSGMNIQGATSYARSHALARSNAQCALYVRLAIGNGGGVQAFRYGRGHAYQLGPALTSAGFVQVYSGTYSASSENLAGLRAGDVVVFQPVGGHPYGHVALFDGQQWISDFRQARMSSNAAHYQGGRFTIYRP
jgi:hypothetical protein